MDTLWIWLKDWGVAGAIAGTIIIGAIKFLCVKFRVLSKQIQDTTGKITTIHVAVSDPDGNPVGHHDLLHEILTEEHKIKHRVEDVQSLSQKHFDDVARLASEEKYRDCDVTKCVHISMVTRALEALIDRINQFEEAARVSRGSTTSSLESLRSQMTDLTRDILATIRVFRGGQE
jgi:hypothetical protein